FGSIAPKNNSSVGITGLKVGGTRKPLSAGPVGFGVFHRVVIRNGSLVSVHAGASMSNSPVRPRCGARAASMVPLPFASATATTLRIRSTNSPRASMRVSPSRLGKKHPLSGKAATAVAESFFGADRGPKMGDERCGAGHGEESAEQAQKKTPKGSQMGHEGVDADDLEHAGEVVAQRHQAPFAANLVEAADQEVPVTSPAFERAEGMLGEFGAAAHLCRGVLHAGAMPFEHVFVFPAIDGARRRLGREAARAQRAGVAIRLAARVPDLDPAAGVGLAAVARR